MAQTVTRYRSESNEARRRRRDGAMGLHDNPTNDKIEVADHDRTKMRTLPTPWRYDCADAAKTIVSIALKAAAPDIWRIYLRISS